MTTVSDRIDRARQKSPWSSDSNDDSDHGTSAEQSENKRSGSLPTYLLLAGVVLFVIPEPTTSVVGVLVILAGLVAWAGKSLF